MRWTVLAHDDVEGLGGNEVHGQVGRAVGQAGRDWRGNPRLRQVGIDDLLQSCDEGFGGLGRQIQAKLLDGNEATWRWLIGTKDRAESAGADLMKHPEGTEGVRWLGARIVRGQCGYSSREGDRW